MTQLAHRHRHHANDITPHQLMARTYGVSHGRRAARRLASVLRNASQWHLALGLNGSSPSAGIFHIVAIHGLDRGQEPGYTGQGARRVDRVEQAAATGVIKG